MAKKLVQRLRKIVNFHVDVPRELQRQLRELENGFYGALDTLVGNLGDYLGISGLDGVKVVPGGAGILVARRSRESLVVTAGGTVTGSTRKDVLRFESLSAHVTVYGIVEPGADDTHRILLINASSYTVTLAHNTTASAARRFLCPHSVDYELQPNECIEVEYQEVATEQRWRVLGDSKPFRIARTQADLPAPVSGVITLTAGVWYFATNVTGASGVQLKVPEGVIVWSAVQTGGWVSNTSSPGLLLENYINHLPFYTQNTGGGDTLKVQSGGVSPCWIYQWFIVGKTVVTAPYLHVHGGRIDNVDIQANGGDFRFLEIRYMGHLRVVAGTATYVNNLNVARCAKIFGAGSDPFVEFASGTSCLNRLTMHECLSERGGLLSLPTSYNAAAGALGWNNVLVSGCTSLSSTNPAIQLGVIPNGWIEIVNCTLQGTAFSGFTAVSSRVIARGNDDNAGNLLQETPNGHIARTLAGSDLTQRHYLRASTGIQLSDNGTETLIASTVADVGIGAADTVLQTNAAGNATEWQKIFNANVDVNALIAVDKLAKSAAQHSVLVSNAAANSFSTDPEVDTILIYEAANFRETGDPGNPSEGAWVHYHASDANLVARFANTYRHDLAPDNPTEGGVSSMAKHFHEKYTFSRDAGTGAYTFLTEGYSSPFGMTHGTSQVLNVRGWIALDVLVAGTPGGTETWRFWAHFNTAGVLHTLFFWQEEYNTTGSGTPTTNPSATGLTIADVSEAIEFGITNPAVDVRLMVEIVGHCWTAEAP